MNWPVDLVVLGVAAATAGAVVWYHVRRRAAMHGLLVAAEEAEAEARRLLDELPEAVLTVDVDLVVQSGNAAAVALLGLDRDLGTLHGAGVQLSDHLDPEERTVLAEAVAQVFAGNAVGPVQLHVYDVDFDPVMVEASFHPARSVAGSGPDRLVVRLRDVSERVRHHEAMEQARHRFQQAFRSAPSGMALVRIDDGRIVDANQALADMLRIDVGVLVGCTLREFTHPDDVRAAQPHRARLELGIVDSFRIDQRYRRTDGEYVWARTRVAMVEENGVQLAVTHVEDVSEQRRATAKLRHAARHDDLTGLPNRRYLVQLLQERLVTVGIDDVAVLFVDVDHFKVVNDSLGHDAGDEVIRVLADRVRSALGPTDVLARFSGDEFIVATVSEPRALAERIRDVVRAPIDVDDHELFVTVSIGYATNHRLDASPASMIRDADAAMYRAKARGRNCVEAFEEGVGHPGAETLRLAGELRYGLERGEVVPYFQPMVDLQSGRVVSYEVSPRWLHPDRGLLNPADFLPLAEETGLLVELGRRLLRDALAQVATWRAAGHAFADAPVSLNVGTRQLVDPGFLRMIGEALVETGVDADSVWLEITETSLLADVSAATVTLRNLRSLGLHLLVDDFGTGYASLTYLKRFPVEAIKIDRSFVAGLGLDQDDTTIVEAVVRLGQSLGLDVLADGIESPLQLARLRELGCERGQGHLFGRPRPAALVEAERTGA